MRRTSAASGPMTPAAVTDPEFMMCRDSAGGNKTIDDFLKVVDELERSQYDGPVGQPEPGPEDQEPDARGREEFDEPLDLRRSESEQTRELHVPGEEPQPKLVRVSSSLVVYEPSPRVPVKSERNTRDRWTARSATDPNPVCCRTVRRQLHRKAASDRVWKVMISRSRRWTQTASRVLRGARWKDVLFESPRTSPQERPAKQRKNKETVVTESTGR